MTHSFWLARDLPSFSTESSSSKDTHSPREAGVGALPTPGPAGSDPDSSLLSCLFRPPCSKVTGCPRHLHQRSPLPLCLPLGRTRLFLGCSSLYSLSILGSEVTPRSSFSDPSQPRAPLSHSMRRPIPSWHSSQFTQLCVCLSRVCLSV